MNCLFCKIANKEIPGNILYENENYLAFLDLNQSTMGHTLIIPKKHYTDYTEVENTTLKEMYDIAKIVSDLLQKKLQSTGFSYMINYLEAQEIKHIHLHILPNFQKENSDKTIEEVYAMIKDE